jgi:hypothetical protein
MICRLQGLKPTDLDRLNVAAKAATHKSSRSKNHSDQTLLKSKQPEPSERNRSRGQTKKNGWRAPHPGQPRVSLDSRGSACYVP